MRDDPAVVDLVLRAQAGDAAAWDGIVERYAPLVWTVCGRYGLTGSDADDVGGGVWLRLVERLDSLREPAALPGWLVRTTQRQCLQLLRARKQQVPVNDPELGEGAPDGEAGGVDTDILVAERRHALRMAFAELPVRCRSLLAMLFAEPPASYAEISVALDLPVGAVGPTRGRCLDRLRRSRALAALELA
ncbi:RNA polymerase sigma factor [Sphaerisporangium perillae]|uniref:RNA polymerase sigma factor n=1 Tax=Sphaerisporangium perillae TaxID=2935860 RepID=UPI00200EA852|nr:sigma-70 family RNA polymerase sigma factor [Sphaerisporangium perillae]